MGNDCGNEKYDNKGMAEGGLLTANNIGTQKYDFLGLPEGFLGISANKRLRTLMGVGI